MNIGRLFSEMKHNRHPGKFFPAFCGQSSLRSQKYKFTLLCYFCGQSKLWLRVSFKLALLLYKNSVQASKIGLLLELACFYWDEGATLKVKTSNVFF